MQPVRAILLKLAAVALFTAMAALVKASSDAVPPGEAVFFRSLFAVPVIVGWLVMQGELPAGLRTRDPMGHLWRGLIGCTAMGLNFTGLGLLPLPEVTAIGFASPLLVVVFAALFLGERLRLFRIGAVMLGLLGVLIVLSPRLTAFNGGAVAAREAMGALVVLGGATFSALAQIQIRRLVRVERTATIVFWFSVTATVLSLLTAPFGWVMPGPGEAAMLIVAGLLGGFGQICLTSAYRYGEAALVAPFDYAAMLLALGVGYFVFAEVPTPLVLAGAALIMLAGGLIIWRERQLGLKRGKARQGITPQG
ncbi:DMT family transporter [Actibacterium sp. MT2.3-13A]|uniref:DMT family transporter n=1 Tax=Actibacterium sp. MT2.3-13A TaxID=2828332 RepID=UPI001BA6960B|nr:DMT family transporter [Actibacterium sp. MT2.3-13A]